jgi:hypothetical protein
MTWIAFPCALVAQLAPTVQSVQLAGACLGSFTLRVQNPTYPHRNIPGLQRNNTFDPRPPAMFERHAYNASPVQPHFNAPPMPSFQPGQIVNHNFGAPQQPNYAASEGGWGVAAAYAQPQHLQPGGYLERQASVASQYPDERGYQPPKQQGYRPANEHDYPPQNGRGSPVDDNPQQFYETLQPDAGQNKPNRQLSVRNRDSDGIYDGMGF